MAKVIIGHHADSDGFCSYEIARRAYKTSNQNIFVKGCWLTRSTGEKKFIQAIEPEDTVVIVDFSLDVDTMSAINEMVAGRFILIDHHRTCYENLQKENISFKGVVSHPDELIAACQLTWKTYFKDTPMPEIVNLIGNFDVWNFSKDPNSIAPEVATETGLAVISSSMDWKEKEDMWDKLIFQNDKNVLNRIKMIGNIIVKDKLRSFEYLYANSPVVNIDGVKLKLVNIDNPILFTYWVDCNTDKCSIPLLMFSQTSKGAIRMSVRASGTELDCGRFCEKFGGGGHEKSAGFNLSWNEFLMFAQQYEFTNIQFPE